MKGYSKAQLGTIEMIMVLVVVVIIVAIAIVFYYNFFLKGIESKKFELTQQEANVLLASITSMPEFQCSFRTVNRDCVDMGKVIALREAVSNDKAHYTSLFGLKNIKIELLYPRNGLGECNINKYTSNDYPDNCNQWIIYNNLNQEEKAITSTPISLYFPITKEFRVGKLIVEVKV